MNIIPTSEVTLKERNKNKNEKVSMETQKQIEKCVTIKQNNIPKIVML